MEQPLNPYKPPSVEADTPVQAPTLVRPFTSVFELFGRAVRLYFGNLATIAGVTLVVFGPVYVLKNYFLYTRHLEDDALVTTRVETILEGVFGALVSAALIAALAHRIETGRDLGVRASLSAGLGRWGSVFGARFRSGLKIFLGVILLVVPAVIWMVSYALTDEIATLEHSRSASRVMARSADLVRGHGWRVLGVGLLGGVTVFLPVFVGGMAAAFAGSWMVAALIDCVNDVIYRFLVALMVLVYFGLVKGRAGEEAGAAP